MVHFRSNLLYLETRKLIKQNNTMKKSLFFSFSLLLSLGAFSQGQDCFKKLEDAFTKRGSYTIGDDMHRNVIISFFQGETVNCFSGKVRVENGAIVSVFIFFEDGTPDLPDKKFYNAKKQPPTITNGISEMIFTADGEKFRVVFIDKLKPKAKSYKPVQLPEDL